MNKVESGGEDDNNNNVKEGTHFWGTEIRD